MSDFQKIYRFDNGYGASVVRNDLSYGNKQGLFELAVLKGNDICYDTHITNDVVGWLEWPSVEKILEDIKNLPKVEEKNPLHQSNIASHMQNENL